MSHEPNPDPGTHILTIAFDDYFLGPAFRGVIDQKLWGRFETRCERSCEAALGLLAQSGSRATFFVNPWSAQRCPDVLREVLRHGHEIALSGDGGPGFRTLESSAFREKVRRARSVVEEACQHKVTGYRRSDVLLQPRHLGALEVLASEGFLFDSSLSPTAFQFRDEPWRRFVHCLTFPSTSIWEFPLSSQLVGGLMIPFAGGNYFRQYPASFVRWALRRWSRREEHPLVLYFRLWDLDPTQPRIHTGSFVRDIRHYRNSAQMLQLLSEVLRGYRFSSIGGWLGHTQPARQISPETDPGPIEVSSMPAARHRLPVSVLVPCFNEEASIPFLARTLAELKTHLQPSYEVDFILIDDGSTDQTWRLLNDHFPNREDVLLLRHEFNRGVAAAILTGLRHAREVACSMDCDCSYDPGELKAMLGLLGEGVDLVTASPYHPHGHVANVARWRITLSRGASFLYRLVTRRRIYTFTSCLRVYRRDLALGTPLKHAGFLGIAELAVRYAATGRTIVEHPATLELRLFGRSKMKIARTVAGHLGLLAEIAWSRVASRGRVAEGPAPFARPEDSLTVSTQIKPSGGSQ